MVLSTLTDTEVLPSPRIRIMDPLALKLNGHFHYEGTFIQISFMDQHNNSKLFDNAICQLLDFYIFHKDEWSLQLLKVKLYQSEKLMTGHAKLQGKKKHRWVPLDCGYRIIRPLVHYQYKGNLYINTHINKYLRYLPNLAPSMNLLSRSGPSSSPNQPQYANLMKGKMLIFFTLQALRRVQNQVIQVQQQNRATQVFQIPIVCQNRVIQVQQKNRAVQVL